MRRPPAIWVLTGVYILVIYATLPVGRPILNHLYSSIGGETLSMAVNAGILAAAVLAAVLLRGLPPRAVILSAVPLITAGAVAWSMDRPEERVHFIEYGLLGLMLVKALGGRLAPGLVVVTAVGAGDELIQLFLPDRVGDVKDVLVNAGGGALGLLVGGLRQRYGHVRTAAGEKPPGDPSD